MHKQNKRYTIRNTQIHNPNDQDVLMSMHNIIEYSDKCSKISGRLWKYSKGESHDGAIISSESIKSKMKQEKSLLIVIKEILKEH